VAVALLLPECHATWRPMTRTRRSIILGLAVLAALPCAVVVGAGLIGLLDPLERDVLARVTRPVGAGSCRVCLRFRNRCERLDVRVNLPYFRIKS